DRKDGLEDLLQPGRRTRFGRHAHLQKRVVGVLLDLDEIRHGRNLGDPPEILADAFTTRESGISGPGRGSGLRHGSSYRTQTCRTHNPRRASLVQHPPLSGKYKTPPMREPEARASAPWQSEGRR